MTGEGDVPRHQGHVGQDPATQEVARPGEDCLVVSHVNKLLILLAAADTRDRLYTRLPEHQISDMRTFILNI